MSKGDTFENDFLRLIFNGVAIANLADNAASGPFTNLQVALHTSDPGEAGSQNTGEVNYTGYLRTAVARTTGGWVVTNNSVSPVAAITFPSATSTSTMSATYASVGTSTSGAGKILYKGALSPTINISEGVTPRVTTGSSITED